MRYRLAKRGRSNLMPVAEVEDVVCRCFGVEMAVMMAPVTSSEYAGRRAVLWMLVRQYAGLPISAMRERYRRANVIFQTAQAVHGPRVNPNRKQYDPELAARYQDAREMLQVLRRQTVRE